MRAGGLSYSFFCMGNALCFIVEIFYKGVLRSLRSEACVLLFQVFAWHALLTDQGGGTKCQLGS